MGHRSGWPRRPPDLRCRQRGRSREGCAAEVQQSRFGVGVLGYVVVVFPQPRGTPDDSQETDVEIAVALMADVPIHRDYPPPPHSLLGALRRHETALWMGEVIVISPSSVSRRQDGKTALRRTFVSLFLSLSLLDRLPHLCLSPRFCLYH